MNFENIRKADNDNNKPLQGAPVPPEAAAENPRPDQSDVLREILGAPAIKVEDAANDNKPKDTLQ